MSRHRIVCAVSVLVTFLSVALPSLAQNARSAVSITGSDGAACTVPDPCRTFGVAMSKTNPGGEVVALGSGGYGPFTITTAVSIIAPPSVHAAIAPAMGDAITVTAGASDRILIAGLYLQAQGGNIGIHVNSAGVVNIQRTKVSSFAGSGVYASVSAPVKLLIEDSTFLGNADGISAECFGAAADRISVTLNRVTVLYSGYGVSAGYNSRFSVNELVSNSNFWGLQCNYCEASILRSVFSYCNTGVEATFSSAKVYIAYSMVSLNTTGFKQTGTGTLSSLGNNLVADNGTDVSGTITPLAGK